MRLTDMGQSEQVKGTLIGTLWYMASEVFRNKPYTEQADILFRFGIIMWELRNKRREHEHCHCKIYWRVQTMVSSVQVYEEQLIGEKDQHRPKQANLTSGSYQQPQPADVPQAKAKIQADAAKACSSSHPDHRPSANRTHQNLSAISVD